MQPPKKAGGYTLLANENNRVTTVTTSLPIIEKEEDKSDNLGGNGEKSAFRGPARGKAVEVVTVVTQPLAQGPTKSVKSVVALSEPDARGVEHRVGETHHNARLTDAQVDEIRDIYERGEMGYRLLAKRFNVGKRTIRDIVNFSRRNAWAAKWKRVSPGEEPNDDC